MQEKLLDVLCEPITGAELRLSVQEMRGEEIWEGSLQSVATDKRYPIRAGIPRFVDEDGYTESFGFQWNRFSKVQLDSANGATYSRTRFEEEVGWSRGQLEGEWGLDGGCGCGRFAEIAAELGADVVALDYSSAVDAAAANLRPHRNVHCVQGDILRPPIKSRSLAFAYSIGVLQHTPDSNRALKSIINLLAPGGKFALTIYARRWYTFLYSKYLVRPLTQRLSSARLLWAIEKLMPWLFPLTDMLFPVPVVGKVAQFMIPVANYVHKTEFSREERYEEAILDTFDMLSPAYDRPLSSDQVSRALQSMGVRDFVFRTKVPVNVVGEVA